MNSIERYQNSLLSVQNILDNNKHLPPEEVVSLISATTMIPIIDVCYIVQSLQGVDLSEKIKFLKDFYKV